MTDVQRTKGDSYVIPRTSAFGHYRICDTSYNGPYTTIARTHWHPGPKCQPKCRCSHRRDAHCECTQESSPWILESATHWKHFHVSAQVQHRRNGTRTPPDPKGIEAEEDGRDQRSKRAASKAGAYLCTTTMVEACERQTVSKSAFRRYRAPKILTARSSWI